MAYSLTQLALLITVVLLLGLLATAWRFRDKPGARTFGALQALSAIWAGLTLIGLRLPQGGLRLRVWGLATGMSLIVAVVWLAFIFEYTGREAFLAPARFGPAAFPLVAGAGLYFFAPSWPPLVSQVRQAAIPAGNVVQSSIGPVGGLIGVYIYLVFLFGLAIVIKSILQGNNLFVGQGLAFVVGSLSTIAASFLAIIGFPLNGYPTTAVAMGSQSLFWAYAVFGQEFLQAVPAVATIGQRVVFEEIDAGVIVIDDEGRITRLNPAARTYLAIDDAVGDSVEVLLDEIGISDTSELPARFQLGGETYRAKSSVITNWQDEPIGQVISIQDITSLIRREQRLNILNRILRHNVRNDMNVVLGLSERLQARTDEELASIGDEIHQRANNMVGISNKAIEIDKLFNRAVVPSEVELEPRLEEIRAELTTDYPNGTVRTNVLAETVHTDGRTLSIVLEELLENALQHAGDAPEVEIEIKRSNHQLLITVSDDGPGIPDSEIEPILSGEETELEHASGLGLWLVFLGTRTLGGEFDVTTTAGGSTVTLSLPDMGTAPQPGGLRT